MKEIENFQQTNNEPVNESPNSHGVRMFGMDRGRFCMRLGWIFAAKS